MKKDTGPWNAAFTGGAALGISIALFFLLISPSFALQNYCAAGETALACFREWSSMFAAWATVAGGVLAAYLVYGTILKMNEQIEVTNRHQRENLETQIASKIAMARQIEVMCDGVRGAISHLFADTEANKSDRSIMLYIGAGMLQIDEALLRSFSIEIGTTDAMASRRIVNGFQNVIATMQKAGTDTLKIRAFEIDDDDARRAHAFRMLESVDKDLVGVKNDAGDFLRHWQPKLEPRL